MLLQVVASSSKGNCYIITSQSGILLLDCGVPFSDVQKVLNFRLDDIHGCIITHEHKDHSKSVKEVMRAGIDVYMTNGTAQVILAGCKNLHRFMPIKALEQFKIGSFIILPFEAEHDAVEPAGFLIYDSLTNEKLLYLTDTYYCRYKFQGINYVLVECNYCKDILQGNVDSGIVDIALARRILKSHFELQNVKNFLNASDLTQCQKIILCHLSDHNSDARRMQQEVKDVTNIDTVVADAGVDIDLQLYPY